MNKKMIKLTTAIAAIVAASAAQAATLYSNDFEGQAGVNGIAGFVIGNETAGGGWYANFGAPNAEHEGLNGYSSVVTNEGGTGNTSGAQLKTYSDYNPWGPHQGWNSDTGFVTTKVYHELGAIGADQLGKTITFSFDAKKGNIDESQASAAAYLAVIKVSDFSYAEVSGSTPVANTSIGADWGSYSTSFVVDAGMIGEVLQIGFSNTANAQWAATGMVYDNLEVTSVPVPAAAWLMGSALLGLAGVKRSRK